MRPKRMLMKQACKRNTIKKTVHGDIRCQKNRIDEGITTCKKVDKCNPKKQSIQLKPNRKIPIEGQYGVRDTDIIKNNSML